MERYEEELGKNIEIDAPELEELDEIKIEDL